MTVFVPKSPFGYTIFCDEVRQESNGKLIYIGVYVGEMIFYGPPPGILPSFCALVSYSERMDDEVAPVTVKLFAPKVDDPIAAIELKLEEARISAAPLAPITEEESTDPMFRILIPIRLSPLVINQEGSFRVRAYKGTDEIRLGTLSVKFNPASAQSDPPKLGHQPSQIRILRGN